jgi:myo-inositol-1(or 4)-monophosphatase
MCCDEQMADEIGDLGSLCVELAVPAGRRAREWRVDGLRTMTKSSPTDLVTEVDTRVERWIAAELHQRRPGDLMIGEEGTGAGEGRDGDRPRVRWLVDPIDGTVNFALGLPQYGVSVAAEVDGQIVAGCVVNPQSGDVFRAELGRGAYLVRADRPDQPHRLSGPRTVSVDRAVVGTGFGYDPARRARQGQVVARLLPQIADIRRVGAASLDLCAVAAGWLDAHFEAGLNDWDYAAGLLIATEAGCVSSGLRGRPAGSRFCAVAGRSLDPEFFDLLAVLGADEVLNPSG